MSKKYCDNCHGYGKHDPRCAYRHEKPKPIPVYTCSICDKGIYDGDRCKDFGGGIFCYSCLVEALRPEDWLNMMDDEVQIAQLPM